MARAVALLLVLAGVAAPCRAQDLAAGFRQPPDSAKPHTWWHWMNGNITREGITLDLEAMKRVGVGGAQIFDVQPGIPAGPVDYNSPEWREMILHAAREANRLGIELCLHNCAGWSSSGGKWITPDLAMQMVTVSETRVKGPARFEQLLAQPPTRVGYYRDIAVIAFPTPRAEALSMADAAPKVTCSLPGVETARLVDGDPSTAAWVTAGTPARPSTVDLEFARPFTASGITLVNPGGSRNGERCEVQVSDDGKEYRRVAAFGVPQSGVLRPPLYIGFEPVTARFYRLVVSRAGTRGGRLGMGELRLESGFRVSQWAQKAGYDRANPGPDRRVLPEGAAIAHTAIVDLSAKMDAEGKLTWDVPAGDWTILRMGHTPTGKDNHPAPEPGRGLECDKLSREAADAHWAGMLDPVIAKLGPLAGKTLNNVLIDSYEVDTQNWTPKMREEFRARRNYDLWPYLPALTGRVVDGLDQTERFLRDYRRTIADLFADNYFGRFAEKAHQHGMLLSVEPYGNGGFDDLQAGARADIPMTEFWAGHGNDNSGSKLASSVAHTNGRKFVGAESFTADNVQGRWQCTPWQFKMLGDLIFCGGVNRFIFHRYAHQPWTDKLPGMTMGPWGFHFERTNTWFEPGAAWLQYIARCQYLLQEGLFVGDLCYFIGENSPGGPPGRRGLRPEPPAGYDYDTCDAGVILNRMSVKDGRIVLPDGMSYRVLLLPQSETMTPRLLRKIGDLVRAGATVVGPMPTRSPSLEGYPESDAAVAALAKEIWGPCDGKEITEHAYGKGKVVWGKPLADLLAEMGIAPDFEAVSGDAPARCASIHRSVAGTDVYFVSSQSKQPQVMECAFRVGDRVPEVWDPETGAIADAPLYRRAGGRTTVTLRFEPAGSLFVVFRRPAAGDPLVALRRDGVSVFQPKPITGVLEIRKATYGVPTTELADVVEVTAHLRAMVKENTLKVRASNDIAGDPANMVVKQLRVEYTVNGTERVATVEEGQTLSLPRPDDGEGKLEIRRAFYGVIPEGGVAAVEKRSVDVTEQLAKRVQNGRLSVPATNALAGDPAPNVVKQLRVEYTFNGEPYTKSVGENDTLNLPDGSEQGMAGIDLPPAEVAVAAGTPVLTAWEPGAYEAETASGKKLAAKVAGVPATVEVAGPWTVSFPPNLGAPPQAIFDRLISWTDHEDAGIRYFSGTATYTKVLDVPAEMLGAGRLPVLDLGSVREMAEVRLNGQVLGILWKPPFRVSLAGAAKPGRNTLEVRVTNLWVNRLIGDEQLPDDCEWNAGGSLKAWPQWLLEGKPRPSARRITFTTWKHWRKDDPLIPAGLLGPVTLRCGTKVPLVR